MLLRNRNIFFFLLLAAVAIFTGVQISLANFNQDIGYPQPIEAFDCDQTTAGWHISLLNYNVEVQKSQVDYLVHKVQQPATAVWQQTQQWATTTIQELPTKLPAEEWQNYQQIALKQIENWRQLTNQIINNIVNDKVDSH